MTDNATGPKTMLVALGAGIVVAGEYVPEKSRPPATARIRVRIDSTELTAALDYATAKLGEFAAALEEIRDRRTRLSRMHTAYRRKKRGWR